MGDLESDTSDESDDFHVSFSGPTGEFYGDLEPIVCLLGWSDATEEDLVKYCEMYKELGCTTIRIHHNFEDICAVRRCGLVSIRMEKLCDNLIELGLSSHPIFFHALGNGAAFHYVCLARCLEESGAGGEAADEREQLAGNVRGAIIDSAPGAMGVFDAVRNVQFSLRRSFASAVWYVALAVGGLLRHWAASLCTSAAAWLLRRPKPPARPPCPPRPPVDIIHFPHLFAHLHTPYPELYVYSRADAVVHYGHVERHALARRTAGRSVLLHCFADSPHVQHLNRHAAEYRDVVHSFIFQCLSPLSPATALD